MLENIPVYFVYSCLKSLASRKICKNTWFHVVSCGFMEQKHARAARNIARTHPSFSKMTWRLRNSPGNTTSFLTEIHRRTDTNRDLTLHSSEQKTGSSELWRIFMTSRIVCCLATLGSNKQDILAEMTKLFCLWSLIQAFHFLLMLLLYLE